MKQTYRDKIVDQITQAATALKEQADNIVDQMGLHTGSIFITIEISYDGMPTIKVEQTHVAYLPAQLSQPQF